MRLVPLTYIGRLCIVVVVTNKAMTLTYILDLLIPQIIRPIIKVSINKAAP